MTSGVNPIFIEISLVIIVATMIAGLMQLLRQPLIIGHIITGLLVGPYFLNILHATDTLATFSEFGIALLLFIVGLSLSPKIIKEVGRVAMISGAAQVVMTVTLGFLISRWFNFSLLVSLYLGLALSFSSTIIILKLLSDKKDLGRLYGKLSIGLLLMQDIIATVMLIFISSGANDLAMSDFVIQTILKGALLLAVLSFVATFILPHLSHFFAQSQEFLFLFAISWGLGLATVFHALGFSVEIGALFAGVALASSPYNYEISARLRPLRDFFVVLFFVFLGSQMSFIELNNYWLPALALAGFVLLVKPLIVLLLISFFGYNKKTSFKTALTVSQLSEFSLILILLGQSVGDLDTGIVSLVTFVCLLTIALSTYMILYSDEIYSFLSPALEWLERSKPKTEPVTEPECEVILVGYDTVGDDFIQTFRKIGTRFLVVDYDPEIISQLTAEKINCKYGDANDNEFLDALNFKTVKMVISTISDYETNLLLVRHIKSVSKHTIIILKSDTVEEAAKLYEQGATYVMMPHYLTTSYTNLLIDKHGFDFSRFIKEREKHRRYLEKRRKLDYHHKAVGI